MVTTIYTKGKTVSWIVELVIGVVSGVVLGSFLRDSSRVAQWPRNLLHQEEAP